MRVVGLACCAGGPEAAGGVDSTGLFPAPRKGKSALRLYVESFDQAAMVDTARIVSVEGAALVERQTSALLGDLKTLTAQMQVRGSSSSRCRHGSRWRQQPRRPPGAARDVAE
jgi:hypothetical protein